MGGFIQNANPKPNKLLWFKARYDPTNVSIMENEITSIHFSDSCPYHPRPFLRPLNP